MLDGIISIGDKIEIQMLDHNGKPVHIGRTFVSQLIDFIDQDVINIAAPIVFRRTILLQVGENYNLCFYTEKGLYQCNCQVIKNHKENRTVISMVRITSNLEKYQRRQYFRLECIHKTEYRVVTKEEQILEKRMASGDFQEEEEKNKNSERLKQLQEEWIAASITDISGGGARFNSAVQHEPGDKIRIKLNFVANTEKNDKIFHANVITSIKVLNKIGMYESRLEFTDVMQKDREILIKYIFEQERRRRRNDLS